MWRHFRELTSYQDEEAGGVLPLMNDEDEPIFNQKEKCHVLQVVFFGGKFIQNEAFDKQFKDEIEQEYDRTRTERNDPDIGAHESFLNRPIDIAETVAAIQNLKEKKAPGTDIIYMQNC